MRVQVRPEENYFRKLANYIGFDVRVFVVELTFPAIGHFDRIGECFILLLDFVSFFFLVIFGATVRLAVFVYLSLRRSANEQERPVLSGSTFNSVTTPLSIIME